MAARAGAGVRGVAAILAVVCAGAATAAKPAAAQQTHLLVVSGIGGAPEFADDFYHWGASLVDAARTRYALPDSDVVFLAENPARDPARIRGRSTRENIEAAIADLAKRARPGDRVLVVLIGHGSDEGNGPRLNLPGPDLAAADWAKLLDRLATQKVAVVVTSASSGGFVQALAGKGRVVVAATRNAAEHNETVFGGYFAQAFAQDGADTDKDGRVTLLEAFEYARTEVARAYEQRHELQTEHAVLDGDGDGQAAMEPQPDGPDARGARAFFLAPASAAAADVAAGAPEGATSADPALRALYEQKRALEARIDSLKAAKANMEPASYEQALEKLLLELARKDREIRGAGGKSQ